MDRTRLDHISAGFSAREQTRGEICVIASGKGGVGKTSVALNLAIQLSRRTVDTILVDADFGMANADILLNLAPTHDITSTSDPALSPEELLARGPAGLRLLCGVSGPVTRASGRSFDPRSYVHVLRRLRRACDLVLVDCGAGVSRLVESLTLASDRLLLVSTPEPTALADAYATLKLVTRAGYAGPVGVIMNMSTRGAARAATSRLQRVAREFLGLSIDDLGYIPRDRHFTRAVALRTPAAVRFPNCQACAAVDAIAQRLRPRRLPRVTGGVWSRVASLFL